MGKIPHALKSSIKIRNLQWRKAELIEEILQLEIAESVGVSCMQEYRSRHAITANRRSQVSKINIQIRRLRNRQFSR